jgi:hypothetical protein
MSAVAENDVRYVVQSGGVANGARCQALKVEGESLRLTVAARSWDRGHCLAVPSGGNADEKHDRASVAAGAMQAQHLGQPATATS